MKRSSAPLLFVLLLLPFASLEAQDLPKPFLENFEDPEALGSWEPGPNAEGNYDIVDGRARMILPSGLAMLIERTDLIFDDMVIEAVVNQSPWTERGLGISIRGQGGYNGYYVQLRKNDEGETGGGLNIWQAPANKLAGRTKFDFDMDSGEPLRLVLSAIGSTLTATVYALDGRQLGELSTEHTQFEEGGFGLLAFSPGAEATFDDLKVYHPGDPPLEEPVLPEPIIDNFDDEDLEGWEHDPTDSPEWYRNAGGAFELSRPVNPTSPTAFSLNPASAFDDFVISVRLLPGTWSNAGIIARARAETVGGDNDSYSFNISKNRGLEIYRRLGGTLTVPGRGDALSPAEWENPLDLVFRGEGKVLTGMVSTIDGELLAELTITDDGLSEGNVGLLMFSASGGKAAIFDNFRAYHPDNPPIEEPVLPEPIIDNFDDGDLEDWTELSGNGSANVVDGRAELVVSSGGGVNIKRLDVEFDDFVVEATVNHSNWDESGLGIGARGDDSDSMGYFIQLRRASISIWDAPASQLTDQMPVDFDFDSGEPLHLVFRGEGSELLARVYTMQGRLAGEVSTVQTADPQGGMALLAFSHNARHLFDDFKAYHPGNPPAGHTVPVAHELTIETSDSAHGTVTSSGEFLAGSTVPITATPASGFRFVRWEGEGVADPNAAETTITVTAATSVDAVFEAIPAEGAMIPVDPVLHDPQLMISRNPLGGMFVSWIGGGTLQWLDAEAGEMIDVAIVSPYLSTEPKGIVRVRDRWNGGRDAEVYVPSRYDDANPMPLVIALHGLHPDPSYIEDYFGLQALAEKKGFLLVQPQGVATVAARPGFLGWDNGTEKTIDDPGYLRGLILAVQESFAVDRDRTFLYGHSAGGAQAYEVARLHGDLIAAVASLEGSPLEAFNVMPNAHEPVSILHLHGTDLSDGPPVEGGLVSSGNHVIGVDHLITQWGAVAGHDTQQRDPNATLDLQDNLPGIDTTVVRTSGGTTDIDVEFWEIDGSKHYQPGHHDDFSEEVIDWLMAHPKPAKQSFSNSGSLVPCEEGECGEIVALVEGTELAVGANARTFWKEVGTTSGYGDITGQYALDMTLMEIPGQPEPVPVYAKGRVLYFAETGDQVYWEQETHLLPSGQMVFTATMLRGTGSLEGIYGRVTGTVQPSGTGFSFEGDGWWWPPASDN